MSFAHWRKCDFQIHTPRDPNWSGKRPVGIGDIVNDTEATSADVDAARVRWAEEFVNQCIDKGLQAVALTDHHEMIMVPYVQQVIEKRKALNEGFDLWLFPGMELTASGGKQCLILFDVDLSDDWRKQAQGKLGIVFADLNERAAKGPRVTQLAINYADISSQLDTIKELRGRYIVLPNVSQGNSDTVLVNGGHGDFYRMPYVGGYLDQGQTINTLKSKNRKRLSGSDNMWSSREIYPLPTSDSRSADYNDLGKNNTWIKLAEPTAKAIRQAFLGHQSRISIDPPQTSSLAIVELSIEGSTILQDTNLLLSPELNSVIGGRGSGKSSLLEYLSFGLGRSCYDIPRGHYSGTERLGELVCDTFVSTGGRIILKIMQDKGIFKIEREQSNTYQPQITYPNGDKRPVTVAELRALFPAAIYSQGELAEIGKQTGKQIQLADLLQFVNLEYKRKDDQLVHDIEIAKNEVREAVQRLASHWALLVRRRELVANSESLLQRAEALKETFPKFSDRDQAAVDTFDRVSKFELRRIQISKQVDQTLDKIGAAAKMVLSEDHISPDLPDDLIVIVQAYADIFNTFSVNIKNLEDELRAKHATLKKIEATWSKSLEKAQYVRDAVLKKQEKHRAAVKQLINLQEEIRDYSNQMGSIKIKLDAIDDPIKDLQQAVGSLKSTNRIRTKCIQDWANEIADISNGKVKVAVDLDADTSEIIEALDFMISKAELQEVPLMKNFGNILSSGDASNVIDRLWTECLSLLYWRQIRSADGEDCPRCTELTKVLGDVGEIGTTFANYIDSTWLGMISTAVAKPEVRLFYCDGDREISFEKASEGQRAAALLFILLEQSGGPLIIDQPEGDLDNKIITDLTEKLHGAKQNRQLIFASHNANIVVNGSSELVAHLDTNEIGERKITCAGAIDKPTVCDVITTTMEGGEKAFKDRQKKYGY